MIKMTKAQKQLRIKLLQLAYKNNAAHIPSALSMLDYFYYINKRINYENDALIVGKPYGQLAYYVVWNINNVDPITTKNKKVFWAESTLGNCLGIATGIAMTSKFKNIFVNISDASLQEGTVLEAAQFIGKYKKFKSNIILCVDFNGLQCISENYQTINDVYDIYKAFGWNVKIFNGHNVNELQKLNFNNIKKPLCLLFKTVKGFGIDFIEKDPICWHYRKLTNDDYIKGMKYLCGK